MKTELIEALKNINIDSESAERIAESWIRLQYWTIFVDYTIVCLMLMAMGWAVHSVWKFF